MCDQKNEGGFIDDVDDLSVSDESKPSSAPFVPELDSEEEEQEEEEKEEEDDDEDDDDDDESSDPAHGHRAQSSFTLRGGGSAFSNRSHSIFDCLESVAQLSSSLKQDNAKDGVFAQPLLPPPCRKTSQPVASCSTPATKKGAPDYLVHPERWTYYSLEDVTETNDQDNSKAAHHFLSSLQQRKVHQENQSESPCHIRPKVIFSRPGRLLKEQPALRSNDKETYLSHLEGEDEGEGGEGVEDGEKLKAGGRRTEHSTDQCAEKQSRKRRICVGQPAEAKQVQKERCEVEIIKEAGPSFTSFRKTKHKNYRKRLEGEDN